MSKVYDSMKACAAGEGIPYDLLQAAKDAGCPAFKGGRVVASDVKKFILSNKLKIAGDAGEGRSEDELTRRKLEQQIRKLEIENKEAEGRLTDTQALIAAAAPSATKIVEMLYQKLQNEMPIASAGMSVAENRIYGGRLAQEIATAVQELFRAWEP